MNTSFSIVERRGSYLAISRTSFLQQDDVVHGVYYLREDGGVIRLTCQPSTRMLSCRAVRHIVDRGVLTAQIVGCEPVVYTTIRSTDRLEVAITMRVNRLGNRVVDTIELHTLEPDTIDMSELDIPGIMSKLDVPDEPTIEWVAHLMDAAGLYLPYAADDCYTELVAHLGLDVVTCAIEAMTTGQPAVLAASMAVELPEAGPWACKFVRHCDVGEPWRALAILRGGKVVTASQCASMRAGMRKRRRNARSRGLSAADRDSDQRVDSGQPSRCGDESQPNSGVVS